MLLNNIFIDDFFASMNNAEIDFFVLRNYEELPNEIGNDIDIFIRKQDLTKCDLIIRDCLHRQGLSKPIIERRYGIASYYLNDGVSSYPIDIMHELCKQWVSYISFEDLTDKKVKNKNFWVPNYSHQFYITISKEILTYGKVRVKYYEEVSKRLVEVDSNLIRGLMVRNYNLSDVENILDGVEKNNVDMFFEEISLRRKKKLFLNIVFFKWLWFRFLNLLKR